MNLLKDLDCRRAKPGADLHDGNNLVLRVGASRRTWTLVWRSDGRVRKAKLGEYPEMGLAAARDAAALGAARVRQGSAPVAPPPVKTPALAAPKPLAGPTVETVLRTYIARHVRPTARDPDQIEWVVDRLLESIHKRPAAALKRADITAFLDELADKRGNASAYRAGSVLRAAFRFAVRRGDIDSDPTHLLSLPNAGKPRERILSPAEAAAVWETEVPRWSRLARVLLLTGLRLREAVDAPAAEIAGDQWTIPADRMKGGRAHAVPMFPALVSQLGDLDGSRWLFRSPHRADQPMAGFSRGLLAIHAASGTSAWTFHDLRRTAASGLQRAGTPSEVIEAVLAHRRPGVSSVYQRHDYLDERRQWLQRWAEIVSVKTERLIIAVPSLAAAQAL